MLFFGITAFVEIEKRNEVDKIVMARFANLEADNEKLRNTINKLTTSLDNVVKRLEWLESSYKGRCAPDIRAVIIKEWGEHASLGIRLAWIESKCQPYAMSEKGAAGLFQLTRHATLACDVAAEELNDVIENARCAKLYFNNCLKRSSGDIRGALSLWYQGHTDNNDFHDMVMTTLGK